MVLKWPALVQTLRIMKYSANPILQLTDSKSWGLYIFQLFPNKAKIYEKFSMDISYTCQTPEQKFISKPPL